VSNLSFSQIFRLNQEDRDGWFKAKVESHIKPGMNVLDVGAGTAPYKSLFEKCRYIAHDFGEYKGIKLGETTEYTDIDIKSDITDIPLPQSCIDLVLCTEVLEHVPNPIDAMKEIFRVLKPDSCAIITAPFTSGSHQRPYHFYAGFSPEWYLFVAKSIGLEILELTPHGGFFRLMAQEFGRVANSLTQFGSTPVQTETLLHVANQMYALDPIIKNYDFSIGYHVVYKKPNQAIL